MADNSVATHRSTLTSSRGSTRPLLTAGLIAGPLYVVVVTAQMLTRDGFDITRHPASVLSNGEHGWIQIATFLITGALYVAFSVGLRRAVQPATAPGGTWGPRLIGLLGTGLIAAGLFSADPVDGFPIGTPTGPPTTISGPGLAHFFAGMIAFLALIAACFVFARRAAAVGDRGWATVSTTTGAFFLAAWVSLFVVPGSGTANVILAVAIGCAMLWTSLLAARQARSATTAKGGTSRVTCREDR
jgi:hypothetical membrane protein